jgi:hypothetical protein
MDPNWKWFPAVWTSYEQAVRFLMSIPKPQFKVLNAIIQCVAIDMVNNFIRAKRAPYKSSHDGAVLIDIASLVRVRVASVLQLNVLRATFATFRESPSTFPVWPMPVEDDVHAFHAATTRKLETAHVPLEARIGDPKLDSDLPQTHALFPVQMFNLLGDPLCLRGHKTWRSGD